LESFASDYFLTLFSSRLGWFPTRFHSSFIFSISVFGFVLEVHMREMGKKEANMGTTSVIPPHNIDFQNDVFHSISNKAIQNVIRDCQLLTKHNLRIQLQEMLHGHDTKFS